MPGPARRLLLAGLVVALSGCAPADVPDAASSPSTPPSPAPVSSAPASAAPSATTPAPKRTTATDPELRLELLAMLEADQKSRLDPDGGGDGALGDQRRTDRLKQIIAEHGWPTRTMVGDDGATAAWAIAQHSDLDPEFQRQALELLREAAARGEASRGDLAYLTDRVAVAAGQPQTYGTQMGCTADGKPDLRPLAEPDRIDELRAEAGLPPLEEYLAELAQICAEGS